jgi:hypothetical protein
MSFKRILRAAGAVSALTFATCSFAADVTLTFEGIGDLAAVGSYYNGAGGTAVNFGVTFGTLAYGVVDTDAVPAGNGNFAGNPSGVTALLLYNPADPLATIAGFTIMNYASGFAGDFSFSYSAIEAVVVELFDGLNGTGNRVGLGTFVGQYNAGPCANDPNVSGAFCNWTRQGVMNTGLAKSVKLSSNLNQTLFDDLTFAASAPSTGGSGVPEPATLALVGAALLGVAASRRAKKA